MIEKWKKLLKPERFRKSSVIKNTLDYRNPFQNDHSRIVVSSPFRRLQDKAQVFPLDRSDFTRTRLTHSLEVSNFAKGLGLGVEGELIKHGKLSNDNRGHIPEILATAGLVHDIGNPPFGHFGEDVIKSFFIKLFNSNTYGLNEEEQKDFTTFDGNAQSFRILRKLSLSKDQYSYNLTYPTLATVIKYPHSSITGNNKDSERVSDHKFGYFQSEKEDFEKIDSELGLNGKRHPLTYLLEAADDIAFSVADIEDGCKKGIIDRETLLEVLEENVKDTDCEPFLDIFIKTEKDYPKDYPNRFTSVIHSFRVIVQSEMLIQTTSTFLDKHEDIIEGNFDKEIIYESNASPLRKAFKQLSYINFNHKSVLKREIAGDEALSFLLGKFISAALSEEKTNNKKSLEFKLYNLLSNNYRYVKDSFSTYSNMNYKNLQLVTDYVSGMTDTFALSLFHELSGYHLE